MSANKLLLAVFFVPCIALGQNRNNLFIDACINEPGLSATFDRKVSKHLELGIGSRFNDFRYGGYGNLQLAVYADVRPYWKGKHSMFFIPIHAGLCINGGDQPVNGTLSPAGFCLDLGFGYSYAINKRGAGPYISIGLDGHTQHVTFNDASTVPPPARDYSVFDAAGVFSIGFKM